MNKKPNKNKKKVHYQVEIEKTKSEIAESDDEEE